MLYAAKTKATDNALTVGGIDGKLQNDVLAFETKADYQETLDEMFANGDNLISLSRKQVESYLGRNFAVATDGMVFTNLDAANDYDESRRSDEEASARDESEVA